MRRLRSARTTRVRSSPVEVHRLTVLTPPSRKLSERARSTPSPKLSRLSGTRLRAVPTTVVGHGYWFIGGYHTSGDIPSEPISYWHLSHFEACGTPDWPAGVGGPHCEIFSSLRPKTVALTILVLIEMLNALNALSQNESLL